MSFAVACADGGAAIMWAGNAPRKFPDANEETRLAAARQHLREEREAREEAAAHGYVLDKPPHRSAMQMLRGLGKKADVTATAVAARGNYNYVTAEGQPKDVHGYDNHPDRDLFPHITWKHKRDGPEEVENVTVVAKDKSEKVW